MVSSSYMYIRYISVYMIYVYIVCMCILKFTSWRGYSWYFSYGHLISVSENGEFNYEKMMVWFVFEKLTLYIIIHHHPIGGEHLPSRSSDVRDMWYSPSLEAWNASPTLALWNWNRAVPSPRLNHCGEAELGHEVPLWSRRCTKSWGNVPVSCTLI